MWVCKPKGTSSSFSKQQLFHTGSKLLLKLDQVFRVRCQHGTGLVILDTTFGECGYCCTHHLFRQNGSRIPNFAGSKVLKTTDWKLSAIIIAIGSFMALDQQFQGQQPLSNSVWHV